MINWFSSKQKYPGVFKKLLKQTQYIMEFACHQYALLREVVDRHTVNLGVREFLKTDIDEKAKPASSFDPKDYFEFICFNANTPFRPFEYVDVRDSSTARSKNEQGVNTIFEQMKNAAGDKMTINQYYTLLVIDIRQALIEFYTCCERLLHMDATMVDIVPGSEALMAKAASGNSNAVVINIFNTLKDFELKFNAKSKDNPNRFFKTTVDKLNPVLEAIKKLQELMQSLVDSLKTLAADAMQYSSFLKESDLLGERIKLMERRRTELNRLFAHETSNNDNRIAIANLQSQIILIDRAHQDKLENATQMALSAALDSNAQKLKGLLYELDYKQPFNLQEEHSVAHNIQVLTLLRLVREHVESTKSANDVGDSKASRDPQQVITDIKKLFANLEQDIQDAGKKALRIVKNDRVYRISTACYLASRGLQPAMDNQYVLAASNFLVTLLSPLGLYKLAKTGSFYFYYNSITSDSMQRLTPLPSQKRL